MTTSRLTLKKVDVDTAFLTGYSDIVGSIIFSYRKPYGRLIDLISGLAFIVVSLWMLCEGLLARGGGGHRVK